MTTKAQRLANLVAIRQTVDVFSPGGDHRGLHTIAKRESNLNHWVESTHPSDREGAIRAFARNRSKFLAEGNPWLDQPELWYLSLGLFQLMVPNHLARWDSVAHPDVLRHPVVATVAAGRLWNRAIQRGAKNLCDMRSLWARGNLTTKDPRYAERCASVRKRLKSLGYPESLADRSLESFGLQGFGTATTEDQYEKLWIVSRSLGITPNPDQMPKSWGLRPGGGLPSTPGVAPRPTTSPPGPTRPTTTAPQPPRRDLPDGATGGMGLVLAGLGAAGLLVWAITKR